MAFCRDKNQKLLFKVDSLFNFRKWFKYGLKAQMLLAQGNGYKQHALKGQKLLAQGNGYKQHALFYSNWASFERIFLR